MSAVLVIIAGVILCVVLLKDVYEKNPYRNYWKMVNNGVDPDTATREALRIYRSNRYGGLENFGRKKAKRIGTDMVVVDNLTVDEFIAWCAKLLEKYGFQDLRYVTKKEEQNADIVAQRDGIQYVFRCKRWEKPVGADTVRELLAGKAFFSCERGIVMSNREFTEEAKQLAAGNRVALWGRKKLTAMSQASESRQTPKQRNKPGRAVSSSQRTAGNTRDEWDDLFDLASMLEDD